MVTQLAPPQPLPPSGRLDLPESRAFRWKNRLLGRPLHTDQLEHERLGKPTALAVFASDNLSSSAYATEEILHVLVPVIGLAAFSLVVPITGAMLVVLGFLILSYRQTIKAYPSAGGAYVVTRDNFGPTAAQVAGASLLTDYILTVAVSTAAGTAALTSAFRDLQPYTVQIAIGFVILIAYGNLRGVRESGKVFAVPTYFFMGNMALLITVGLVRFLMGDLPHADLSAEGLLELGEGSDAILYGAGLAVALKAFASAGTAVTGVEAISNGVSAFKVPEWKNARTTLVVMGSCLGVMFLGLSMLAAQMEVVPFEDGIPTVISQVGDLVYGGGAVGTILYFSLQAGTMLILVLAANTSFADFPRLASFQAEDSFLPRQLTKRGHRLVFSNGVITLSLAAIVVLLGTGARVQRLIPLYAIGVFLSFTLSQAGMTRHHLRLKEPGWRVGLAINGIGAVLSGVICIVFAVEKFTQGAWMIVILIPVMVVVLLRLHHQYVREEHELVEDAQRAASAPILRRHVVLVFVDSIDQSSARAIQYARTLTPDELRAVHIAADQQQAAKLADDWRRLGLARLPLEIVDCPDRRIDRAALELVAEIVADGQTEVSILLPRRLYRRAWHKLLHDRTADAIAEAVAGLPHANVTVVPYHLQRSVTSVPRVAGDASAPVRTGD